MKKENVAIFAVTFALAFGGGYLFWKDDQPAATQKQPAASQAGNSQTKAPESNAAAPAATPTASEGKIFSDLGCTGCHSISSLKVQGGATGPDLSQAYKNVKGKHGVEVEDFLKKPTSAVMSGVIGGKPLTDDQRKAVVEALKKASEAK